MPRLPARGLLVIDEPERIWERVRILERELGEEIASLLEKGGLAQLREEFRGPR